MKDICFNSTSFLSTSLILVLSIISLFIFYKMSEDKRIESFCKNRINEMKNMMKSPGTSNIKIQHNQPSEMYPERRYTGPNDYQLSSQSIGYIYNNNDRFPLFENRQGRNYYYHVKDDSRNGIRVILNTPKNEMISDNDSITIPELNGEYNIKLYDYSGNQYNPFLF